MSGIGGRKWAAGLLVAAAAAGAAHGQATPQELLDRAKQQQQAQVAEAKLQAAVDEVLRTAPTLARSAPEKAVRNLKDTRALVDGAAIGEKKREAMVKALNDAIAAVQGADPKVDELKARQLRSEKNQKLVDAAQAESKEVNEALAGIAKDLDSRREPDAKRKLADISAKYPNNPSVLILQDQRTTADALTAARWVSDESALRWNKAMHDVAVSALPPIGDIEYPKDFIEKGKKIKERNAPKLTAEETKLLKALDTPIKGGVSNAPFQEAVQLLSTAIDQKIYVDAKSLEGLGVNLDDKVDVPGNVSARSALRVMLQSKGLTFILRDGIIQVVTVEAAKKQTVTRAYEVRDLVSPGGFYTSPLVWGPYLDAQQTQANAQVIIDAIQKSVDPASWAANGGVGSIVFHYPTMSLIVRAPSEVHSDLYRAMTK